jgi:hypothetical protein
MSNWYIGRLFGPVVAGPFSTKAEAKRHLEAETVGIIATYRIRAGEYEYRVGFAGEDDADQYCIATEQMMELGGWDTNDVAGWEADD